MTSRMRNLHRPGRIYWLLSGSRNQASSRLHGYLIHEHLLKSGRESVILFSPDRVVRDIPVSVRQILCDQVFTSTDIVVFQKLYGPNTVIALETLKILKIPTIYIDCDLPFKGEEASLANLVICTSEILADLYRDFGIRDVIMLYEAYEILSYPRTNDSEAIRCVWFGNMTLFRAGEIGVLRKIMGTYFPEFEFLVISNRLCDYVWTLPGSWDLIRSCDVVLITGDDRESASSKSANRLVQAMALGLPTLAYPIPSYRAIVRNRRNAILCETEEQWIEALRAMKNTQFRAKLAATGFRYARRYFSPQKICVHWERTISSVTDKFTD